MACVVPITVYVNEKYNNDVIFCTSDLGIPPLPKGTPRIKVSFSVDVNGIMSVQATEESTGKQNKIIIENRKHEFCR